ncbi:3-dehydroquinate dehydratase [Luteibacter sp. UNC138MFCol5.1]|uniref:hypothetical protein n=1 Tax=Luteibacter sp. UNC138MFCol5.1 TaxID=1502774 RepID=UPI0008AF7FF0|nr:hypothetical protein [Luteibacter sp. UNC138MFCol5.1]SEO62923.1 3-dehydroquinate dehydratase [Luteibacter sp. UNC138MFCol5.1]
MSIVVITGPHAESDTPDPGSSAMCRLWERAQAAGVDLAWRRCDTFAQLSGCLEAPGDDAELLLLDVDAEQLPSALVDPVRDALSALRVPYIEVHDRSAATDASSLAPGHPSLVSVVVPGNAIAGYDMALSIGLRFLKDATRLAA